MTTTRTRRVLRWLRCHVLSLHRADNDFYETCMDCGYWKADND